MPNLALAHAPTAPPATAAMAGKADAATDAAGDAAQGSPFATVLQEQLAAQILMPLPPFVELPAVDSAVEAPSAANLPLLLDMVALSAASATTATPAEFLAAATAETEDSLLPGTDATAAIALALPAIAAQPGQVEQKIGAGDTPQDLRAATRAADATAILAATADAARGGRSGPAAGRGEEALTAFATDSFAPRAEGLAHAPTPQARAAEHAVRIEAPLGTRQWDGEFASRLAWMAGKNEQRADLVLTPPQLGRIEVSLSVNGEQATAIFTSASATVRDAIENALPRLREVLLESGINLGQTQVGSESPQQSPPREENGDNRGNGVAAGHDGRAMPSGLAANASTAWVRSGRGIIDVFA